MSTIIPVSHTTTVYPSGFDDNNSSYASATNISNGYTSTSVSTYAQFYLTTGSEAHTWIYYTFDLSSIPNDATITSVTCSVRDRLYNVTAGTVDVHEVQMYTGITAMGTATNITSTSATTRTLSPGTSWTVAQVKDARVVLHAQRGTSNTTTSVQYRFYGADLTIEYTVNEVGYIITATSMLTNTQGVSITPEYQAILASDTSTLSPITITNKDGLNLMIIDNGSKITSFTDTSYTYTISTLSDDHVIKISSTSSNFSKINNNWYSISSIYQKSSGAWAATTFNSAFPSGTMIKQGDDILDEKPLVKFLSNCDAIYNAGYASSDTSSTINQRFTYRDNGSEATYYILTLCNGTLGLHRLDLHLFPGGSTAATSTATSIIEYGSATNKLRVTNAAGTSGSGSQTTTYLSSDGTGNVYVYNGTMITLKLKDTSPLTGSEFETLLSTTNGITGSYGVNSASSGYRTDSNYANYLPCYILTGQSNLFGLGSVNSSKTITSILGYNGTSNITNRSLIGLYGSNNDIYYFSPTGSSRAATVGGITFIYM